MDMTTSPGQIVLSMGSQPVELWNTSLPCSPVIIGTLRKIQPFPLDKNNRPNRVHLPRTAKVDVKEPDLQPNFCKAERELHGDGALANTTFARQHKDAMLERHNDTVAKPASPCQRDMYLREYTCM